MSELKGMKYLKNKLALKRSRVLTRYSYYDMKNVVMDFGISTPPDLRFFMGALGWCARAVDTLEDRLVFREFTNDIYDINEIYNNNNKDILFDSAMTGALISSCDFIYIAPDDTGYPQLQVIDGGNATGIIDPITYLLREGYAVLERDADGNVIREAYFTEKQTEIYEKSKRVKVAPNPAGYVTLVPVIYKPDSVRAFGHSRISRACMSIVDSALRTVKRSEISAEFFSYPQKYVTGLSNDAGRMEAWKATMSSMLAFTKDEDGDHPIVGQFQQQAMTPHLDMLRMFASLFAAETGMTLDDLGFVSQNPSSSEAIKASHETLRLIARKAQRNFEVGFLNAGFVAACVRDKMHYTRALLVDTKAKWAPLFEPDAAALSGIGDGALKINQAMPGYIDEDVMEDLTGITK